MKFTTDSALRVFDNLVSLALHRAELHPERPAYIFLADGETEEPVLTYGGLLDEARRVAVLLQKRGIKDEPVVVAYEASSAFVIAFWGCLLSGNIAVPTYSPRGEQRVNGLVGIIENCGARVALTHDPYMKNLSRSLDRFPALREIAWLRTDIDTDVCASDYRTEQAHPTAVLQYTSGSTGRPKGVQITHANVLSNEEAMRFAFGHTETAVVINCLPHYHDMGLFGNLLQPFYVGGLCVSMPPAAFVQKPSRLLNALTKFRGSSCGGPNFIYSLCVDKFPNSGLEIDLSSWNITFVGAERIDQEVQRRFIKTFAPHGFRKEAFRSCYGLAEATLIVSLDATNRHLMNEEDRQAESNAAQTSVLSCGIPCGNQSFVIVDPATREACAQGQEGEVWLQGDNVAQGYWRNSDTTNEVFGAFTADGNGPFLRTGDCGYLSNGDLYISGRLSGFIIVDGENIHAEDIEACASNAHPSIGGGRCIAIPSNVDGREDFILVVEVARSHVRNFDSKSPGDAILNRLAAYCGLVPRTIVFVKPGGCPSTPNGKTSRHAGLAALASDLLPILGECHRSASRARNEGNIYQNEEFSPTEWLTAAIAERLGIDPNEVPADQSFVLLGIDSLGLIEIAQELSVRTRREIDPTAMWEYPTIVELTAFLSA
jgi:acyl-CoA synthetase (AMP-forming)/AMP-acid ligase II/acyl carrier protein